MDEMEPILRPFSLVIPFTVQKDEVSGKNKKLFQRRKKENPSELKIPEFPTSFFFDK